MKLQLRPAAALVLISLGFFFILACLDYLLMANFDFWRNVDLLYRYWIVLWLVVVVFGFSLSFVGYVLKLDGHACLALFLTVILLFAGGALDLFYALFALVQGRPYTFDVWSPQYRWFGAWVWLEQAVWTSVFFGAVCLIWWKVLGK